jgi:hypothetical protein
MAAFPSHDNDGVLSICDLGCKNYQYTELHCLKLQSKQREVLGVPLLIQMVVMEALKVLLYQLLLHPFNLPSPPL